MDLRNVVGGVAVCGMSLLLAGCPRGEGEFRELGSQDDVVNTTPDHGHHHDEGPHGGHILEFGKYHGEIVMDESRAVTVYILGDDAKSPAPVADATVTLHLHVGEQEQEVEMAAAPLEGETDGQSSRFTAPVDAIPESIKDIEGLEGEVILKTGDDSMTAKIAHDHDHDHGHDH